VAAETGGDLQAAQREMVRRANIVKIGEPEEIASLAAFILSPENRLLQGALIDLDGGLTKTV
jgi:3-oxoacyl-[acyl-carrier protein] reductase